MKTSRRRNVSSPNGIQWGFALVVILMLGVSVLLMISAGSRFSGEAWGGLVDWNRDGNVPDEDISVDGFIVVDLSDMEDMAGAAYASQFSGIDLQLPGELDASLTLPEIDSAN